MTELLTLQQKSSVRGTLSGLEKTLRDAQGWLDRAEEDGILYRSKVKILPERRRAVSREISSLLERIAKLSTSLELEKTDQNPLRLIRSELVIHWANLLDSRSTKLKRYGAVPAQIAERLDPAIRDLADAALHLSHVFDELANEQE